MTEKEKQIEEMAKITCRYKDTCINYKRVCSETKCENLKYAEALYNAGYRKQSDTVDNFAERLKESHIKYSLPLLGLSTKTEIENYVNDLLMQFSDVINAVAKDMKGGESDD